MTSLHYSSSPARRARLGRPLLRATALALALGTLPFYAAAQDSAPSTINLPAQSLSQALLSLGQQARVQLYFDPTIAQGLQAPAVRQATSVEAALAQLLAGTGIEFKRKDNRYTLSKPLSGDSTQLAPITVHAARDTLNTEQTGSYTATHSNSATRLNLSLRETPQSVSVITRQQMDDQGIQTISDALQQTPGITVNRDNSESYSFYSRGFNLENFQFDGLPSLSSDGGAVRDNYSITNSAIYDRIEILKGATGLVNGAGYPSGVINMVRKRPTSQFQGHAQVSAGSWDTYGTELDLSGPLAAEGALRGRVVGATQDNRSFMDYAKGKQQIFYGILEADLGERTTVAVGLDYQRNRNNATTNEHLPAFYSNGEQFSIGRHVNPADRWAWRNQDTQRVFADLNHRFDSGWTIKLAAGQRDYRTRQVMSGLSADVVNAQTYEISHGFYQGGAARFDSDSKEKTLDFHATGPFKLLGREHELVLGANYAKTHALSRRWDGDTDKTVPDIFEWNNNATEPTEYEWWLQHDVNVKQHMAYGAAVLKPHDRVNVILGARQVRYDWSLESLNALHNLQRHETQVNGKIIPYLGLSVDLDEWHTAYASYTDVFKPQAYNFKANGEQLEPLTGKSMEVGMKGEYLDGKLNASMALFQIKQDNVAEPDPINPQTPMGGVAYIAVPGVTTRGLELELSGEVMPNWQVHAGYTYARSRDAQGVRASPRQPEHLFKLATYYRLPWAGQRLTLGGNVQWQSGSYFTQQVDGQVRRFERKPYALVGLSGSYEVNKATKLSVNINNLFDKHYYAGIGNYNTVFWGAPRNVTATLRYQF